VAHVHEPDRLDEAAKQLFGRNRKTVDSAARIEALERRVADLESRSAGVFATTK
jgi:hypothetical protein